MTPPPPEPGLGVGPSRARSASGSHAQSRRSWWVPPKGSLLRELPLLVATALIVSLLIKAFLVQAFYIPSASMQPTLEQNDRVLVSKLTKRFSEVHRGDVVVFHDPDHWLSSPPPPQGVAKVGQAVRDVLAWIGLAPATSERDLVKRVIGVGGDHVVCCDVQGRITVNGVPLNENYLYPGDVPSTTPFDVKVPPGELWVMGDHRSDSEDSRYHQDEPGHGFVPVSDVVGRTIAIVWPLDRIKRLSTPPTFLNPKLTTPNR